MPTTMETPRSSSTTTTSTNRHLQSSSFDKCSNPFRIPRHVRTSSLRKVPQIIRERLAHVTFGYKICSCCRNRVYQMLKERKQLKPSPRLAENNNSDKRRSDSRQSQRKSEVNNVALQPATSASSISNITSTETRASPVPRKPSTSIENVIAVKEEPIVPNIVDVPPSASVVPANEDSNLVTDKPELRSRESTMSRKSKSQEQLAPAKDTPKKVCCFCGLADDNELEFGKFYEHSGIVTHYYCLLLSSNMEQKGNDNEGILGFLADDIQKEIRRGKRLNCSHCRKNGATLGCCNVKCKKIFHFPCGLKFGSLHQFFGEFRSYCINHRPRQKIDDKVKREVKDMLSSMLCYICYESVEPFDTNGTLWAPCCKKNAWFHRKCVQQLAMSAGYFFKCPLCNNKREFQTAMLEYGIYIPRQDASWELVPNAFEELLYRHDRCDAKACICPKGRKYTTSSGKWDLILCQMCGSQGVHLYCGKLKWSDPVWQCEECTVITNKPSEASVPNDNSNSNSNSISSSASNSITNSTSNSASHETNIHIGNNTLSNSTTKEDEEDSDSDISVGNESTPLVSHALNIPMNLNQIRLRPGPRSYKLQQFEKIKKTEDVKIDTNTVSATQRAFNLSTSINPSNSIENTRIPNAVPKSVTDDVICIDSEDEGVEILCESVMRSRIRNHPLSQMHRIHMGTNSNSSYTFSTIAGPSAAIWSNAMMPSPLSLSNSPTIVENNEQSPFNIIISNVTSVPAELFASDSEEPTEVTNPPLPPTPILPNNLKRRHEEINDEESVNETTKRARLDNVDNDSTTTMMTSCHGDAGTSSTMVDTNERKSNHDDATTTTTTTIATTDDELHGSTRSTYSEASLAARNSTELALRSDLDNNASSNSSGCGRGSKSRSTSIDRSGLIPDRVRLSDLKFKIRGKDVELSYLGACKIQMKIYGLRSPASSNEASKNTIETDSVSPFAGSNQNLSSEKSSKSYPLRSDDSDESSLINKNVRTLRSRSLRAFVYEDDNTLLEYPTSAVESQKITRRSSTTNTMKRNQKENCDPEVSSSSNNTIECFERNNDSIIQTDDPKKKDSNVNQQRLLRRSNRIVHHFCSVQQANGETNKFDQDKHLTNVDLNDLRFITGKVHDIRSINDFDAELFKVSIDLKKITNLLSNKPELFFNNRKTIGAKRRSLYKEVDCKSEDEKFLVKSQSFDCLFDLHKRKDDYNYYFPLRRSKSYDFSQHADLTMMTDVKDCVKKKLRKSQRQKSRQIEKHECVR